MTTARVYACYASCCFCNRRKLGHITVPYHPFRFANAALKLARFEGIKDLRFSKPNVKSAYGQLHEPCVHRRVQDVRIAWTLEWE